MVAALFAHSIVAIATASACAGIHVVRVSIAIPERKLCKDLQLIAAPLHKPPAQTDLRITVLLLDTILYKFACVCVCEIHASAVAMHFEIVSKRSAANQPHRILTPNVRSRISFQCLVAICATVLILRTAAAQTAAASTAHGETADPARKLQPRHYNPHPFAIQRRLSADDSGGDDVVVINDSSHSARRSKATPSNHVKRRQSPALFNQGPIQFPTSADATTGDSRKTIVNQQQQQLQHNRRPFLGGRPSSSTAAVAGTLSNSLAGGVASDYDDYVRHRVSFGCHQCVISV